MFGLYYKIKHKIKRLKVIMRKIQNNKTTNNSNYDVFQEEFGF